jgi:hypothetical protein
MTIEAALIARQNINVNGKAAYHQQARHRRPGLERGARRRHATGRIGFGFGRPRMFVEPAGPPMPTGIDRRARRSVPHNTRRSRSVEHPRCAGRGQCNNDRERDRLVAGLLCRRSAGRWSNVGTWS